MKKTLLILSFTFLMGLGSFAQVSDAELNLSRLRPLDSLIQDAIETAPLIHRLSKGQEAKEEEMKIDRKAWMQHIALTGNYNYGNAVFADQTVTAIEQQTVFRTNTAATYNLGISLRLPISEFTSQKNKVRINQLAIEEIEFQKEDLANLITEEVIKRYSNLERSLSTLKLQAVKVQADEAAVQVTENYFKSGEATIDEYRMALDILNTAKIELQKTKSDAWFYLKTLEELVGKPVIQ
jgi:outer membrane protein TolC